MGINGISSGYYEARYTNVKNKANTRFVGNMGKTAATQNASFVLHISDEADGEAIGSSTDRRGSVTVYKPKDFDPSHPVYKVKAWDVKGSVTAERMVDVAEVDPISADYLDMFAYSSHLADSGKCPDAQGAFIGANANYNADSGYSYFDKANWFGMVKDMMQMQYDVGNLAGYAKYKQFWDSLPSCSETVMRAYDKTLKETEIDPFPMNRISTALVIHVEQGKEQLSSDFLGNTVESATAMVKKILERIYNPISLPMHPEFAAEERKFYERFLDNLNAL